MSRAVQLVLLSVVILTYLQTGVAHDSDDGKYFGSSIHVCHVTDKPSEPT